LLQYKIGDLKDVATHEGKCEFVQKHGATLIEESLTKETWNFFFIGRPHGASEEDWFFHFSEFLYDARFTLAEPGRVGRINMEFWDEDGNGEFFITLADD
jgi:hypothetical protein